MNGWHQPRIYKYMRSIFLFAYIYDFFWKHLILRGSQLLFLSFLICFTELDSFHFLLQLLISFCDPDFWFLETPSSVSHRNYISQWIIRVTSWLSNPIGSQIADLHTGIITRSVLSVLKLVNVNRLRQYNKIKISFQCRFKWTSS